MLIDSHFCQPYFNPPTANPTKSPTLSPTAEPTKTPSLKPSSQPSELPSLQPSGAPSTELSTGMECRNSLAIQSSYGGVPACPRIGVGCTTEGTGLLNGRANLTGFGPSSNTLDSCVDGSYGSYMIEESNDSLTITSDSYHLIAGNEAYVVAKVWAWGDGQSDAADFYYTTNLTEANWTYIGTVVPSAGGFQKLRSPNFTLPSAENQAVRVNFRYGGLPSPCSGNAYDDTDDLMYSVLQQDSELGTSALFGNFFAVRPRDGDLDLIMSGLTFPSSGDAGPGFVRIYHKPGSHSGFERNPSAWTMLYNSSSITPQNGVSAIDLPMVLPLEAGALHSFFVLSSLEYEEVNSTYPEGAKYKETDELEYYLGKSTHSEFVGCLFTPRAWTGQLSVAWDTSSAPSTQPSYMPSEFPSELPSVNPSVSFWPTSVPSVSPTDSTRPSMSGLPSSQVRSLINYLKIETLRKLTQSSFHSRR